MNSLEAVKNCCEKLSGLEYYLSGGLFSSVYREEAQAVGYLEISLPKKEKKELLRRFPGLSGRLHPRDLSYTSKSYDPKISVEEASVLVSKETSPLEFWFWLDNPVINLAKKDQIQVFGFPALSVEAYLLSRFHLLNSNPDRALDLDSINSIFNSRREANWAFIRVEMAKRHLSVSSYSQSLEPALRRLLAND